MIEEIVQIWIDELCEEHGVSELTYLHDDIIFTQIEEAEANIDNCNMWGDKLGVACNEYFIECLEDCLSH